MSQPARCTAVDRFGHRCGRARHKNAQHSAYGRDWNTAEKRRPNPSRTFTPGWSRKGGTPWAYLPGTREAIRAGRATKAAA